MPVNPQYGAQGADYTTVRSTPYRVHTHTQYVLIRSTGVRSSACMYGVQLRVRRAAKSPTRNVTLEYRTKRCSSGTLISRRVIWIHMFRCGGCVRCVLRNPYALEFLV